MQELIGRFYEPVDFAGRSSRDSALPDWVTAPRRLVAVSFQDRASLHHTRDAVRSPLREHCADRAAQLSA